MKFKILLVILLLAAVGGGYYYYTQQQATAEVQTYETAPVVRMDLMQTVSATGTVQPRDSVEVSSKITARIKEVLVQENDEVSAGQTVAILDGKDFEAKRDQAKFRLTNAEQKLTRIKRLYDIGAKSREELEDAEYEYDTAKSLLEETESDVAETVITSPMDGVVVGEPKTAGSMATQGSDNPTVIMRIADLSEKQIKAKVDETDIGSVRVDQSATFTVDAYPNEKFDAYVTKISQTDTANSWDVDKSSSSSTSSNAVIYYYVTLTAPDTKNLLLPAMTARLDIVVGEVKNALCVPIAALKTDNQGSYVEKITHDEKTKSDAAERVYVAAGLYGDEYVEITVKKGSLLDGDEVSISYEAEAKKAAQNTPRRMGPGGPPM
ncbi:MAG: efflux RND transporter periplasmic adaptor subunit [Selenomonadaceae bacterium]|nr:efflux RND transporter periplasmic adaptor subunit [Selenomonadaceae bacterium]